VLHQMVTVMQGGQEMRLSKRAGSYLTLRELVDEVGRDAVRYFFLMRRGDSHLVFDVDLAKSQTEQNPVFYVQMAHARMSGIFRVAGRAPDAVVPQGADVTRLDEPEELELMKELAEFPAIVAGAAQALEPHRLTGYLEGLARIAHAWYHKYRVLGEPEEAARLALAAAVRQVRGGRSAGRRSIPTTYRAARRSTRASVCSPSSGPSSRRSSVARATCSSETSTRSCSWASSTRSRTRRSWPATR